MLNPVRMRIIHILATTPSITVTEVSEKMRDIPRTTIYRHVKILLENDILTVVSEKKIRGSLERTLSVNIAEIKKHNTLENASQNVLSFLLKKYTQFNNYFNSDMVDTGKDQIFCNNTVLMLNDQEFDQFLIDLRDLLLKNNFEYKEGRRARDISIISAPPESDN
ncbi:MAG: helix-turn-helix domain-containing protein [Anaerolineaceae bacterium]